MSDFDHAFMQLHQSPTPEQLEVFTSQVETLSKMLKFDQMKRKLQDCLASILREQRFDAIRLSEHMLRLYKLLGSYSRTLGGRGVYEQLDRKGYFSTSLKFYLQWAEQCAKERVLDEFKKVLQKARDALSPTMTMSSIESGFRDLVDEFFDGNQNDLFCSPDDTMDLFRDQSVLRPGKRNKRRSSVCFLRQVAPINNDKEPLFGRGTKTLIRPEFVGTPAVHGVSIEEFRLANYKDTFGEDVEHQRRDSGIVHMQPVSEDARKARDIVDARMNANLNSRRRPLPALVEGNADEEEEKRSRFNSPVIATKDAVRPPLRQSGNLPDTITLSSDTKDHSYNELLDESNEKLKQMAAGRENTRPDRTTGSNNYSTTASCRTAKSSGGLDLQAENNCLEAHAMFSETLHLGAENKTMPMETAREKSATQVYTDFSVLCDPDPTMTLAPPPPGKKTSGGLNVVFDEQAPPTEEPEEPEPVLQEKSIRKIKEEVLDEESRSSLLTPPTFSLDDDDVFSDELVHGFGRKTIGGIVTSTPAAGVPFIDIDSYFGNKSDENAREAEEQQQPPAQPTFAVPQGSAFNKMMRRKSQAPSALASATTAPTTAPISAQEPKFAQKTANSSIDCLSDNLGRRLSIGADEIKSMVNDDSATDMTGCINRRRSEIIKKGDINPWDETLRRKLMATVRTPVNMHEFPERAAKIQANRDYEVGGEILHIQTLIGQGGYAKVYKAVNEEKKTVAVKFEVPSCSWEVYICDQMRNRLIKDGGDAENRLKMANWCIMQVMDAYVFTTASLLVNEYHEYGNLLECVNKMMDPNWHISCFLVTQMARILKEVHECKIIHGDVKPDNFMITRKIDSSWDRESLMSSDAFVIKLIDWGRAIDMMQLKDQTFKGRAGTEGFDTPEMLDGRSWTYQADFYGFAVSMAVLVSSKYPKLNGDSVGNYSLSCDIKRRNVLRDTVNEIATKFVNIPSCDELPDWNEIITTFSDFWEENFDGSAWRQSAGKFNEACELAASNKK